jgi:hypothetical protein
MSTASIKQHDVAALRERVAAVIAEFDVPLPKGDAALSEAARRLDEMSARFHALFHEFEITMEIEEEEISRHREPLDSRFHDLLMETEPQSLAGAATLLRYIIDSKNALVVTPADGLVANVLALVERIAAKGGAK